MLAIRKRSIYRTVIIIITLSDVQYQLMSPYMYRPNPNKRAIRIFNNYFIVGLYVVHIDFPIWCWYTLVPQTIKVIYLFSIQILIIHHTTRYTISTNAPMMLLFVHISPFCAFKTYIYIENVWNCVPVFVLFLFQWLIFIIYWQKMWCMSFYFYIFTNNIVSWVRSYCRKFFNKKWMSWYLWLCFSNLRVYNVGFFNVCAISPSTAV